jgi:hypothetical protein
MSSGTLAAHLAGGHKVASVQLIKGKTIMPHALISN